MKQGQFGFTLVELVSVMVLIAILSVFIAPKLTGTAGMDVYVARDQLISAIRFAQQHAMYDQADKHCYQLVTTAHDYVVERSIDSGLTFSQLDVSYGDVNFRSGDTSVVDALKKVTLPVLTQRFDGLGNPVATCAGTNSGSQSFNISAGTTTISFCIYSTGYVRAGTCS
jgi:MSHA pilin protein MshC